jgi:hypothetical protein
MMNARLIWSRQSSPSLQPEADIFLTSSGKVREEVSLLAVFRLRGIDDA